MGKKQTKHYTPCKLCTSPYRYQVESAWKNKPKRNKEARTAIAKRYKQYFGHKHNDSFYRMVQLHFENPHYRHSKKMPYLEPPPDAVRRPDTSPATLKSFAQGLLDLGQAQIEYYKANPDKARKNFKFADVTKAQDSVSKRMAVETQKSAMHLQMAKMFGGFITEIEDAEVVEDGQLPELEDGQ